ncbi:hypothetical protein KR009_001893 [Drosophila setifemur]|nr:hypothetical protein KR009_001893 [Drosophila setifemur]
MNGCYNTIKYTGLLFNLLYLLLGIGVMSGAGLGLQVAEPNTPEHTYFVKSLVLGGTICMVVMFGCYGIVSNLWCVNMIVSSRAWPGNNTIKILPYPQFTLFILLALVTEYLQLHHFHSLAINTSNGAWQQVELTWNGLDRKTELIHDYKATTHCCGYSGADDYKRLHLLVPPSCYQGNVNDTGKQMYPHGCLQVLNNSKIYIQQRDKLYMWAIIGLELFILMQTVALSVMLFKLRQRQRLALRQVPPGDHREPRCNHVTGSRAQLLNNI